MNSAAVSNDRNAGPVHFPGRCFRAESEGLLTDCEINNEKILEFVEAVYYFTARLFASGTSCADSGFRCGVRLCIRDGFGFQFEQKGVGEPSRRDSDY